jgi:hypothetical protein
MMKKQMLLVALCVALATPVESRATVDIKVEEKTIAGLVSTTVGVLALTRSGLLPKIIGAPLIATGAALIAGYSPEEIVETAKATYQKGVDFIHAQYTKIVG